MRQVRAFNSPANLSSPEELRPIEHESSYPKNVLAGKLGFGPVGGGALRGCLK